MKKYWHIFLSVLAVGLTMVSCLDDDPPPFSIHGETYLVVSTDTIPGENIYELAISFFGNEKIQSATVNMPDGNTLDLGGGFMYVDTLLNLGSYYAAAFGEYTFNASSASGASAVTSDVIDEIENISPVVIDSFKIDDQGGFDLWWQPIPERDAFINFKNDEGHYVLPQDITLSSSLNEYSGATPYLKQGETYAVTFRSIVRSENGTLGLITYDTYEFIMP